MLEDLKKELAAKSLVRFYVRARPNAPKTKVLEIMVDESVKISIAAKAEDGKANEALIKFLSKEFGVSSSKIRIVSGKTNRVKLIEIRL